MNVFDIFEAKYSRLKDEQWLYSAFTIADGNIKRAKNTYSGHSLKAEVEYWQEYKQWLKDKQQILQDWYEEIKADRDTFVEHAKDMIPGGREKASGVWHDANRLRQAEIWSGNVDQHDYKTYWKLIEDADKAEHDYAIMASNTMMDLLGGLRDERH